MITLNDISSKVFSDQELGYSKDEVDDFLDEIANDYAALIKENRTIVATAKVEADQARADLAELKKAADDYRARFQRLVLDQVHVLKSDTELFADN